MRKKISRVSRALIIASTTFATFSVQAVDLADISSKIKVQSGVFQDFISQLNSPNQSMRVSAFNQLVNSKEPTLRELAISEALKSSDETMQTLGFQQQIMSSTKLVFLMTEPKGSGETEKAIIKEFGGAYPISFTRFYDTGGFGCFGAAACKGSLNGKTLSYYYDSEKAHYCKANMTLQDNNFISGYLACKNAIPIPISARLR
ncbi:hypothetical protein [Marinomonas primoryensis]|jgi:hypothetical protein|uniref:hypothetical protein n=1 Tax=Marinomonas primoryensis TaxID=178399 RepID=UPI0037049054